MDRGVRPGQSLGWIKAPISQLRVAPIVAGVTNQWDCVVVGGGAAGLSAALVLGRARRATLVVDAGRPSNAPAEGIGGLLGHNGQPPAAFYAAARDEVVAHPNVTILGAKWLTVVGSTTDSRWYWPTARR